MCFGTASRPPVTPIAGGALDGRRIELEADDGSRFSAFAARGADPSGAAILVLPDVRGLHPYYEELALRFAEAGVDALAIDYFGRTAGAGERGADFEFMPHVAQTTYAGLSADARAGVAWLRTETRAQAIFSVGFCFGGRLSFLLASQSELELAGVIGFYGQPLGVGRAGMPPPLELVGQFHCPVLGIFGGADESIPPESVEQFTRALLDAGVENDVVTYPGAPHSFFDRKQEQFASESTDAWNRTLEFVRARTPEAAAPG